MQVLDDRIVPSFLTTLASTKADGTQVSSNSFLPALSADGRFVAFDSDASDLVSGDGNGQADAFLHDRTTGITTGVSTNASGTGGNGTSDVAVISGNGRFVAFASASNDLVSGDTNSQFEVFVKDRVTGAVTRVSVSTAGAQGNGNSGVNGVAISRDGRFVAYGSNATRLATDANGRLDVFVTQRPLPAAYVAGTGPGGSNVVKVFDAAGTVKTALTAYPGAYTGGVFVALGDASGDGIDEVVTSTGTGGTTNIRVFSQDGNGGALLASFFAYPENFTGGWRTWTAAGSPASGRAARRTCGCSTPRRRSSSPRCPPRPRRTAAYSLCRPPSSAACSSAPVQLNAFSGKTQGLKIHPLDPFAATQLLEVGVNPVGVNVG